MAVVTHPPDSAVSYWLRDPAPPGIADPPLETCPKCGGKLRKKVSAPAFQFKGTGWYVTDYARKGDSGKSSSSESSSSSVDSSASPAKKADAKPEPAGKPESAGKSNKD